MNVGDTPLLVPKFCVLFEALDIPNEVVGAGG